MTNELATKQDAAILEQVVIGGDLSKLTPQQRVSYYNSVCNSVGLNPLTKPFDYLKLSGRLVLYARKDATEQLRSLHGISIGNPDLQFVDDLLIVSVSAKNGDGRTDADIGVVTIGNLKGDNKANAIMKAVTKAKRRVTLSIAGLGWLDETEIETIPDAQPVIVTVEGEIVDPDPEPKAKLKPRGNGNGDTWNPVQLLVDAELSENEHAAMELLNSHVPQEIIREKNPDKLLAWAKLYRKYRDGGATPEDAATIATDETK